MSCKPFRASEFSNFAQLLTVNFYDVAVSYLRRNCRCKCWEHDSFGCRCGPVSESEWEDWGVCQCYNACGVWCRKVDWKAIKVMAELKFPGFTKLNFRLKKHRYFQLMRQAAYLTEKTGLPPYSERFYLPHFVDDDGLLVYEARGSNFSLAGSFPDYQLDDDGPYGVDGVVVVGRWQVVRRWFARLRDRMRR